MSIPQDLTLSHLIRLLSVTLSPKVNKDTPVTFSGLKHHLQEAEGKNQARLIFLPHG